MLQGGQIKEWSSLGSHGDAQTRSRKACAIRAKACDKDCWTKFTGKSFHSACNTALRSRWRATKTYGDNYAKDRDVTFMLKDAPNWGLDAKASLESRTVGRKLAKARAKAFWQTSVVEAKYTDQVSSENTLP